MFKTFFGFFAFFVTCLFGSSPANAGFFVCNDSGLEVSVAVGWSEGEAWGSRGWFVIPPAECALPIEGELSNRYYYFFATATGATWGDGAADTFFCAGNNAFYHSFVTDPPCAGHRFRKVDVGDSKQFTINIAEGRNSPEVAARQCASKIQDSEDDFVNCWINQVSTAKQRQIIKCANNYDGGLEFGACASRGYLSEHDAKVVECAATFGKDRKASSFAGCLANEHFGKEEARLVNCAIRNRGSYSAAASCSLEGQLTEDERKLYSCVADHFSDYKAAGICIAGNEMNDEQRRLATCAMQSSGNWTQMGVCAAGSKLTPEQQVFAQCAVTTGGQPYAFAGCVGSQLTVNELQKCAAEGVGGDGCFGKNNTIVKFVDNAWKDVTKGPGPNNDLVGRDGFVMNGLQNIADDIQHGPGENNDLVGKKGFVCQNLLFGC